MRKGTHHTPETRAKIAAAGRGRLASPETRAKQSAARRGRTLSPEARAKVSAAMMGNEHSRGIVGPAHASWRGPNASYRTQHQWVARHKGRASEGVCSHADATCSGQLEHANISGQYLRDVDDYMVLCRSHHRRYDAR